MCITEHRPRDIDIKLLEDVRCSKKFPPPLYLMPLEMVRAASLYRGEDMLNTDIGMLLGGMRDLAGSALPYCINDEMLRALLDSGSKSYPSLEKLEEMAKNGEIGSFKLFVLGMEKDDESSEIMLFLMWAFSSIATRSKTEKADTEIEDKLIIFACHMIANRWSKLEGLCSGLSSRVIHNNKAMLQALAEVQRRAGQRFMFMGAVIGSTWRLKLKFKKRLPKTSPAEQIHYLLHESDDPEDRRKILAIARACTLLKDKTFVKKGGLQEILGIFGDDAGTIGIFLDTYLQQTIESNAACS